MLKEGTPPKAIHRIPGLFEGWDPAMDPGRSRSNLTSCDPTNLKLFTPDTHFTAENTLGMPMNKPLPWGETPGRGSVGKLRGSGKAQLENNTDLQIRDGSGQPETDDFYLPRQISPWFIPVFCSRR